MKTAQLALLFLFVTTVHGLPLFASEWERPISRADLIELDKDGNEINTSLRKTLTLHQRIGAPEPTSFTLTEEMNARCAEFERCPASYYDFISTFRIVSRRTDTCGAKQYIGEEVRFAPSEVFPRKIRLTDHSSAICEYFVKYLWHVEYSEPDADLRYFGGNPQPIDTIQ